MAQIPIVAEWVQSRLSNVINAYPSIRFEASLYGPLTSYLSTFFPTHWNFMIKPQGILRPENTGYIEFLSDIAEQGSNGYMSDGEDEARVVALQQGGDFDFTTSDDGLVLDPSFDEDDDNEDIDDEANTSFDSYGNPTTSREVKGSHKGNCYPDFLIVKATASLTDDKLLLIVEVKKDSSSYLAALFQIQLYLRLAATKCRAPFLQGLLIIGDRTESFFLSSEACTAKPVRGASFITVGQQLKTRIHNVAMEFW